MDYEIEKISVNEKTAGENTAILSELIAATKQYKELLKLYIDELGMGFNNALLVKRMHE